MSFAPKKSLGQNFLNDTNIINSIVDIGEIKENDIIIEVGPGSGVLTEKILNKRPKKLTVIVLGEREVDVKDKKSLSKFFTFLTSIISPSNKKGF